MAAEKTIPYVSVFLHVGRKLIEMFLQLEGKNNAADCYANSYSILRGLKKFLPFLLLSIHTLDNYEPLKYWDIYSCHLSFKAPVACAIKLFTVVINFLQYKA